MTKTDTTQNIKSQPRNAKGQLLPKVTDTPMKPIYDAVNKAFVSIRTKHPEIPNAVLVIGASSTKAYGHFAPASWEGKKSDQHEIMVSGESLQRGAEDVLGTLIHECAHALATARDIKDTSRQGRFHNAKFKALAEELGIVVTQDKKIGWSPTTLPAGTAAVYKSELAELKKALKTFRITKMKEKAPKTTIRLESAGGRKLTVPIKFFEAGTIYDEDGEAYEPVEES